MENIDAIERLNQLEMDPIETLTSNNWKIYWVIQLHSSRR